jgi:hypothetical protein
MPSYPNHSEPALADSLEVDWDPNIASLFLALLAQWTQKNHRSFINALAPSNLNHFI